MIADADVNAAALAAGQDAHLGARLVGQVDQLEHLTDGPRVGIQLREEG